MLLRRLTITALISALAASAAVAGTAETGNYRSGCASFWRADTVFVGRVVAPARPVARGSGPRGRRVTFDVVDALRGATTGERIEVRVCGSRCAVPFATGREYLVYASRIDAANLSVEIDCSSTRAVEDAEAELAYARAARAGEALAGLITVRVSLARVNLTGTRLAPAEPLRDVPVRLAKDATAATALTDQAGNAALVVWGAGRYDVSLDVAGGYYMRDAIRAVNLADNQACEIVEVTVAADGRVAGRVVDSRGAPIAGLTLELSYPASTDRSTARIRTVSDRDGRYEFVRVPAGTFVVGTSSQRGRTGGSIAPRLFHRRRQAGGDAHVGADRVRVAAGQRVALGDFILPTTAAVGTVDGIVFDVNGAPAVGARVFLKGPAEGDVILTEPVMTDDDGRFVVSAWQGRGYLVFAERARAGQPMRLDVSDELPVVGGRLTTPLQLRLIAR